MTSSATTDWTAVARTKLTSVLGEERGVATLEETLRTLGLPELRSVDELHTFAQALLLQGGFAGAVGGLLSVHAVLRGARR